jgi:probable F420-dependent oxidoreductase
MQPEQYLGRVGVWTFDFEQQPAGRVRDAATELEELGYGTIWYGEAYGREAFTQAALLLSATSRAVVASGIANIFLRHPMSAAAASRTLAEAYDGRFLLGLGGHRTTDQQSAMGMPFHGNAVTVMNDYLDTMDATQSMAHPPATQPRRALAALGPKMMKLAGERSWGAHTYLVPPEHTAQAREILGPDALLAVEQGVILDTDPLRAKEEAHAFIGTYVGAAQHQRNNMLRLGFTDDDLRDGGSDRLVDALVAYGNLDTIAARVQAHFDAGADHVCVQAITRDTNTLPLHAWRELATALVQ